MSFIYRYNLPIFLVNRENEWREAHDTRNFDWDGAIFAVIFIRGLRSGSSFIYSRYMDSNGKRQGPRGFGRTGEKNHSKKRGLKCPL